MLVEIFLNKVLNIDLRLYLRIFQVNIQYIKNNYYTQTQ